MKAFLLALLLTIAGMAHAADMTILYYTDFAADGKSTKLRFLVTPRFVRQDDGEDRGDFAVYDRTTRTINMVSAQGRRTVVIRSRPLTTPVPDFWSVDEDVKNMANGGRRFVVSVNGQTCLNVISAPEVEPAVNRALAEFKRALAPVHAKNWETTPDELRKECELANDGLEAAREYLHGLPLAVRYHDGRRREYDRHEIVPERPRLFQVPRGFKRWELDSGGSGGKRD